MHFESKGVEQGVYATQFSRQHRKIKRNQGDFDAGLFLRIGTGGLWPATRAEEAGYTVPDNGRCLMCKASPDSTKHRAYQCPVVLASEVKEIRDTNDLCAAALEHCEVWPCFWLRGRLLQLPWLPQVSVPQETQVRSVHGAFCEDASGKINLSMRRVYLDESGGEFASTPFLRRAGWGAAILQNDSEDGPDTADWKLEEGWFGTVEGEMQTATRGTLQGLLFFCACSTGPLESSSTTSLPMTAIATKGLQTLRWESLTPTFGRRLARPCSFALGR